jgi:hypothetical protein
MMIFSKRGHLSVESATPLFFPLEVSLMQDVGGQALMKAFPVQLNVYQILTA